MMGYLKINSLYIIAFWAIWQFASLFSLSEHASAFYPGPALSIALIAFCGPRYIPALILGIALSNFPEKYILNHGLFDWWMIARQTVIYGGAGYVLYFWKVDFREFHKPKIMVWLLGVVTISSLLSSFWAGELFSYYKIVPEEAIREVIFGFWTGDLAGTLIFLPAIILLLSKRLNRQAMSIIKNDLFTPMGLIFLLVLPLASIAAIYFHFEDHRSHHIYIVFLFIPLVTTAILYGLAGGIMAGFASCIILSTLFTLDPPPDFPVVDVQALLIAVSLFSLVTGGLTSRNRSEIELRNQLLSSTQEGYMRDDANRVIRDVNPAMCKLLGLPRGDIIGKPFVDFIGNRDKDFINSQYQKRLDGISGGYEITLYSTKGKAIPCFVTGTPIVDDGGNVTGTFAMYTDISGIKKTQSELARMGRLVAVNEMGSSILHEINSPIQTTSSTAYLALKDYENGKATLEGVIESMRFVQDAMETISQVETRIRRFMNGEPSKLEVTDINKTITLAIELISAEARQHQVHLELNLQPNLPQGMADTVELEQVLINLIKNACEAMVDVDPKIKDIDIRSEMGDDGRIKVTVSDNGSGVPEDLRERIFEAFKTTKSSGTGMGLSICRNIMEGFGGTIEYFPNEINGSSFVLSIPLAKEQA